MDRTSLSCPSSLSGTAVAERTGACQSRGGEVFAVRLNPSCRERPASRSAPGSTTEQSPDERRVPGPSASERLQAVRCPSERAPAFRSNSPLSCSSSRYTWLLVPSHTLRSTERSILGTTRRNGTLSAFSSITTPQPHSHSDSSLTL